MSFTLFKANIKNNRFIWLLMAIVFCFYLAIIMTMFDPEKIDALNEMLDMLPEAMVKAMNFDNFGTTLLTYITGYIYGFLVYLFPMVVSIVVNHRLIASLVDKGSMAYLLSTPNSRIKVALTQAIFSLASITAYFTFTTLFFIIASSMVFPGDLEIGKFIGVNFYVISLYYAVGGIGFFGSCLANENRLSLSIGVGFPVTFLILQMLGNVGERFSWLGKLSLFSLFNPDLVVNGDSQVWIYAFVLVSIAAVLYGLGIYVFKKKNLYI